MEAKACCTRPAAEGISTAGELRPLVTSWPRNTQCIEERDGFPDAAGDIFGITPIYWKILAFKLFYYLTSLHLWKESLHSYKLRRNNVKPIALSYSEPTV